MNAALQAALSRFAELGEQLSAGERTTEADRAALLKEYSRLAPIAEKYEKISLIDGEIAEARRLAADRNDPEIAAFAGDEVRRLEAEKEALSTELKTLLIPRDERDGRNVIVEIRAGAGGEEAALFAAVLYRMYTMYAASLGFSTSRISENATDLGGFREISFSVEGDGAYAKFKFESGVHRVQRVPVTESQGRIQTSTVTVAVLPEAKEIEVEISPADVQMETMKSTGAGGQHINKTESAVRILHKPTGIVVECQEERSQFKNREKALKMLRARLYDLQNRAQNDKIAKERRDQVGSGDRSERIRTYNYAQNRVTDHRIALSLYCLDKLLDGDLEELISALAAARSSSENTSV